jgi:hypothetical protein
MMEEWNNGKSEEQKDGRTEEWQKLFLPNIRIFLYLTQYSNIPFFQFSLIGRELR